MATLDLKTEEVSAPNLDRTITAGTLSGSSSPVLGPSELVYRVVRTFVARVNDVFQTYLRTEKDKGKGMK